jgi:hypothetical protein
MVDIPVKRKSGPTPAARNKIDALGLDAMCEELCAGGTLTAIAKRLEVNIASLLAWIEADPNRSARTRESRVKSAQMWDEKAETVLVDAADLFELAKARELAQHYRWRAKAVAPREYGDKVTQEHTGAEGGPITVASVNLKGLSDDELVKMQQLLAKAVDPV